jgi:hypothetical protein
METMRRCCGENVVVLVETSAISISRAIFMIELAPHIDRATKSRGLFPHILSLGPGRAISRSPALAKRSNAGQ